MNELFFMLWTQLWQVTVVAIIVLAATRTLTNDRPHLAHALWLLVLLKCITPPVFSSELSAFSWLTAEPSNAVAHKQTVTLTPPKLYRKTAPPAGNLLTTRPTQVSGLDNATSETRPSHYSFAKTNWRWCLVIAWALGAVVSLSLQLIRLLHFIRQVKQTQSQPEFRIESLVSDLSVRLRLKRKVRTLVTESPFCPAVIGLLRPTVLLPASVVNNNSNTNLEPLIAHELIHIRRGDLWWALLQTISGSLFWFHPLVRTAVTSLTRESERSCDEETVACLAIAPADYARSLLDVLEQKQLHPIPALPGVKPVEITSKRLERVMNLGHGSHKRTPWWIWVILIACGAIVLPGAQLVRGQTASDEPHPGFLPTEAPPNLIVIETRFVSIPKGTATEIDWVEPGTARYFTVSGEVHRVSKGTSEDTYLNSQNAITDKRPVDLRSLLEDQQQNDEAVHRLRETDRQSPPMFQSILSKEQLQKFLETHPQAVTRAPTATIIEGTSGFINDRSVRPFVTQVVPITGTHQTAFQPVISLLPDGASLMIGGESLDDDQFQISGNVVFSQITEVNTFTFKTDGSPAKPDEKLDAGVSIQVPSISVAKMEFENTIVAGQTLAFRTQNPMAEDTELILLISPRDVDASPVIPNPVESGEQGVRYYLAPTEDGSIQYLPASSGEKLRTMPIGLDQPNGSSTHSVPVRKGSPPLPLGIHLAWGKELNLLLSKHNVRASRVEIDAEIENRAETAGRTTDDWIDGSCDAWGIDVTRLRQIVGDEIGFRKLPVKTQNEFVQGKEVETIWIRSGNSEKNSGTFTVSPILKNHVAFVIQTAAEVSVSADSVRVKGKDLKIYSEGMPDNGLWASANIVELRFVGESLAVQLQGEAMLNFDLRNQMTAEKIVYNSTDSGELVLEGLVRLDVGTAIFSSDSMSSNNDGMLFEGNATIQFTGSKEVNIKADTLQLDHDGTMTVDGTKLGPKINFGY